MVRGLLCCYTGGHGPRRRLRRLCDRGVCRAHGMPFRGAQLSDVLFRAQMAGACWVLPEFYDKVGNDNMILVGAHIGHDSTVGSKVVFTNGAMAAGHTEIGDRAILGAMVGIHQFARVGKLAMIGAGAMVSHDAPPFAMIQGDRAKLVAVNKVGLHRNGYTAEQKALVKRVFRLLFWRAGTLHQRLEFVRGSALHRDPICQEIVDFVAASKRGICSPRSGLRNHSGEQASGDGITIA